MSDISAKSGCAKGGTAKKPYRKCQKTTKALGRHFDET